MQMSLFVLITRRGLIDPEVSNLLAYTLHSPQAVIALVARLNKLVLRLIRKLTPPMGSVVVETVYLYRFMDESARVLTTELAKVVGDGNLFHPRCYSNCHSE